jgi:hypothetical protein
VAVVSFAVRVIVALATNVTGHAFSLAPDQHGYMAVATLAARGELGHDVWGGFARTHYWQTFSYTGPLTALIWAFGSHLLFGQLLSTAFGAATASLTYALVARVASRGLAVGAGLLVALWPSQIVWSSLALRDSMVWACLAACALLVAHFHHASSRRAAGFLAGGTLLALLGLSHLREPTFIVAMWSCAVAVCALASVDRWMWRSLAVAALILVPIASGDGIAGLNVVSTQAGRLGTLRSDMAAGADSAFVSEPNSAATSTTLTSETEPTDNTSVMTVGPTTTTTTTTTTNSAGNDVVDNVRYFPRGVVAMLLRPYPWESGNGPGFHAAGFEALLWVPMYALAGLGALVAIRRRLAAAMFPALCSVGVIFVNALSQGNTGTAFRQRAQLVYALVFFAAIAVLRWRRDEAPSS